MYETILVPTDGSQGAEAAIARALDLARTNDATVHALFVVPPPGETVDSASAAEELRREATARGREAAIRVQDRASELGLDAVREVREGTPYRTIVDYVDEFDVDLVVMGTHGQAGPERAWLGSTTERVLAGAPVPVLAVRLSDDADVPPSGYRMYDHVLIPTDGSDAAERAGEHALEIAELYGADVHVVYVVDSTSYAFGERPRSIVGLLKEGGRRAVDAIAGEARDRNLPVTTDVLRGVPEEEILAYAEGVDADLIAMGTRGRVVTDDWLLGSTTARLVGRSDIPVLAVG